MEIVASKAVFYVSDAYVTLNNCVIMRNSGLIFGRAYSYGSVTLNNCIMDSYTNTKMILVSSGCKSSGNDHALEHVKFANCFIPTAQIENPNCLIHCYVCGLMYVITDIS